MTVDDPHLYLTGLTREQKGLAKVHYRSRLKS